MMLLITADLSRSLRSPSTQSSGRPIKQQTAGRDLFESAKVVSFAAAIGIAAVAQFEAAALLQLLQQVDDLRLDLSARSPARMRFMLRWLRTLTTSFAGRVLQPVRLREVGPASQAANASINELRGASVLRARGEDPHHSSSLRLE